MTAVPFLPAPVLSQKRREDLDKTVLRYIFKPRRGTEEVAAFLRDVIGDISAAAAPSGRGVDRTEDPTFLDAGSDKIDQNDNQVTPSRSVLPPTDTTPSPRRGDSILATAISLEPQAPEADV